MNQIRNRLRLRLKLSEWRLCYIWNRLGVRLGLELRLKLSGYTTLVVLLVCRFV